MQKKSATPLLVLLGILLAGVVALYHPVLLRPNSTMMGDSADAIKNYYTPWYHAKWDSSYTWFEGMNYPYGDHVVYADAQPLLSNAIKLCGLADYTVGIMNYAMLLSIVVAGWLLYRILLRWQMDAIWAALAAAAIALLSPQVLKFNAHYGLAYCFVVPLIWHLALRAFEKPSIFRSLALTLTLFLLGWLHPYYVMISALFLTALWAVHSMVAWRSMQALWRTLHFGMQVIVPVVLFTVVMKVTDPILDRPSNPYGFDQYMATWKSIFMPLALWGFDRIPQAIWHDDAMNWEGVSYIGLIGVLVFVGYWGRTAYRLFLSVLAQKLRAFRWVEGVDIVPETKILITVSMLAGLLIGLFACGVPFAFKPELTTEVFPPIKQFRSLGRFSWVFFYTWVSFSFYLLWRGFTYLKARKLIWPKWVFAGLIAFTLVEGLALNAGVAMRIAEANPPIDNAAGDEIVFGKPIGAWIYEAKPYPAIMVLPYFHEGSENFHIDIADNSRLAFQVSILTGKPMLNVMMSRTSFSQSWAMLQLVTEPQSWLAIESELGESAEQQGFFGIRTGYSPQFDGPLVQPHGAKEFDGNEVYTIHFNFWPQTHPPKPISLPDTLFATPFGHKTSSAGSVIVWEDFGPNGGGIHSGDIPGYHNGLGKEVMLKDNNLLHDGPMPFQAGDTVIVSLWIEMKGDRLPLTELGWEEWHGDEKITWHYLSLNNSIKRLDGDWALCEREEVIRDPNNKIQINVTRWKRYPPRVTVDKLLIRKKGVDVYGFENGAPVWLNNRYLPLALPIIEDSVPRME